jgi:hypothetical protein
MQPKEQEIPCESLFSHKADYWIIRYHGKTALLKSTRGLRCLAVLLRHPGREFHVGEFVAQPTDISNSTFAVDDRARGGLCAGIPVLDERAKGEYRRRLNELRQDLAEAELLNDYQRKAKAQNEVQAIATHLAYAVGLGGRDRRVSSEAERARSAATKCIRRAIRQVGDAIPSLGYHLETRIKTGYFCSYNPHPERPVSWKF